MKGAMSIKSLLESKQTVLESKLKVLLDHPVTKGESTESAWIDFLRSFLPSKYAVDKGFAFDSDGKISDQLDIIVHDSLYAPLIFGTESGEKFITAESIYAVFECKQEANKSTLEYANSKIESVTKLKRTSRYTISSGRTQPPRKPTDILGGLLAVDGINNQSLEKHVLHCTNIKLGCIASKTTFFVPKDYADKTVVFSSAEETLLAFFFLLLDELYKMGTVAAIDIRDYANASLESLKLSKAEGVV